MSASRESGREAERLFCPVTLSQTLSQRLAFEPPHPPTCGEEDVAGIQEEDVGDADHQKRGKREHVVRPGPAIEQPLGDRQTPGLGPGVVEPPDLEAADRPPSCMWDGQESMHWAQ